MNVLGLCISYDRVQEIEATVTNVLCDNYRSLDAVVPSSLLKDVFTTAAIDNIDHNTSSSTAVDSFTVGVKKDINLSRMWLFNTVAFTEFFSTTFEKYLCS